MDWNCNQFGSALHTPY